MLADIVWNEGTIAIALGCSIPIVAIISAGWCHVVKTKSVNALKWRMVEQGYSPEDIERVINAGTDTEDEEALEPAYT